jgi:hypothetical protein
MWRHEDVQKHLDAAAAAVLGEKGEEPDGDELEAPQAAACS